jgi:hypothetical protein
VGWERVCRYLSILPQAGSGHGESAPVPCQPASLPGALAPLLLVGLSGGTGTGGPMWAASATAAYVRRPAGKTSPDMSIDGREASERDARSWKPSLPWC